MTTSKQRIITSFSEAFNQHFYNELVVGKLAHQELKDHVSKGDEVDITMPGTLQLFDYDGGDLPTAEAATISTCKVKLDRGKAFHFELFGTKSNALAIHEAVYFKPAPGAPNNQLEFISTVKLLSGDKNLFALNFASVSPDWDLIFSGGHDFVNFLCKCYRKICARTVVVEIVRHVGTTYLSFVV